MWKMSVISWFVRLAIMSIIHLLTIRLTLLRNILQYCNVFTAEKFDRFQMESRDLDFI